MILFKKDFAEQGAYVDYETKNLSFLKMAIILNKMGVKNNDFFLSLYDRDLIGIDPYNLQDESVELKQRIALECKRNFFYFIRELVRISASGLGGIPYILNRSNLAQAWIFLNSIDGFQVMPRQIGKTIGSMCIACWYLYIAGYNVNWGMFCKGIKLQNENVDRLKKLRDALPKWLVHQTVNDTNNKEGVFYDALKNGLLTFVAQGDKQAAGDQARGQSFAVESWDEIAYYNNIDLSFPAATAGMNQAGQDARESGLPSANIMTTTAGDIDDPRGRWCYNLVCDALRFTEKLYDCEDRNTLWSVVQSNSRNNVVYMEYSYKQLGKDEEWFDKVTRNKGEKIIAKDYLNQWLHGADGSIFDKDLLEKIQNSRKDPVAVTNHETVLIRWYDDPKVLKSTPELRDRPYVLGLDTSDNVGRDYTTLVMLDPYDLHPVCTSKCNTANLYFVTTLVMSFLRDFPRCIFIPERNKNGAFLLDYIFANMQRDSFNPLTRIYNKYLQEYDPDVDLTRLDYNDGRVRQKFGFSTTSSANSRGLLYSSVLMNSLNLAGSKLGDSAIIDEISGLTMKNGRVDHTELGHDDLLIAFLLACYFILFGLNHNLYGIRPDEFMCNIKNDGSYIDKDAKKQMLQAYAQIREYRTKLKQCTNPVISSIYQRELQKLVAAYGDAPAEEETSLKPIDQIKQESKQAAVQNRSVGINALMNFA